MHKQGFDGAVFGDACEDEPPTFTIAARDKGIEFALGNEGSHVLPLQIVEDLLEAGVPAEDFPPMAA
jgi:hypothetical protein